MSNDPDDIFTPAFQDAMRRMLDIQHPPTAQEVQDHLDTLKTFVANNRLKVYLTPEQQRARSPWAYYVGRVNSYTLTLDWSGDDPRIVNAASSTFVKGYTSVDEADPTIFQLILLPPSREEHAP